MAQVSSSDQLQPYDAPLSFPEPSFLWSRWMCLRGINNKKLTQTDVPVKDLTGKWILITGGNNGIGEQAVYFFARCGANMVLASRVSPNEKHPAAVVEQCRRLANAAGHEKSVIEWWEIDMSKLRTVEAVAARWLDTGRPLDILCNNAGMGTNPGGLRRLLKTEDGFEFVHQVNFTSHALLTMRLLPSLARADAPRVVCTTSCMTYLGKYDLRNFNGEGCQGVSLYNNNKLYFQVWLTELHERLMRSEKYRHVTVNGVHPGYVNTGIWTFNIGEGALAIFGAIARFFFQMLAAFFAINPEQGSYCIRHAATSVEAGPNPLTQGVGQSGGQGGGRYFSRIWETTNMPHNHDADAKSRVWRKVDDELQLTEKGLLSWTK